MKLYHPSTVLLVALFMVAALQVAVGLQFEHAACAASPRQQAAGFPLDDAWIHQVYARSFAERLSFDYNPGHAEAGQSSLLWGALLAPVHAVAEGAEVPIGRATRLFGIGVWVLLALAAAWLVQSLPVPGARFGGFAAALLVALDPALAFAAVSGMEPLLLALWFVLACHSFYRARPLLTGVFAGLAILTRPEGLLVAALLSGGALLRASAGRTPERPTRLKDFLMTATPCALMAALWTGFCLCVTGRPLPNTFYVKAIHAGPADVATETARLLSGILTESPFYHGYVGYLFLGIGCVALLARCGTPRSLVFLLTPVLFPAGLAMTRPMPEPASFYWERYLVPVIPLLDAVLAVGFAALGAVLADAVRRPRHVGVQESCETPAAPGAQEAEEVAADALPLALPQRPAQPFLIPDVVLAIFLVLFAIVPFYSAPDRLQQRIDRYARNVADVDSMNVEAALWLAEQPRILPRMPIATQDAGAVRYFTRSKSVIDLIGLNDHELVAAGLAGERIADYLDRRAPAVFVLLDPDPGAVEFALYASRRGLREVQRFTVAEYSLFGRPIPRAIKILADLPP